MPDPQTKIQASLPIWRRLSWRLGTSFVLLTAIGMLLSSSLQYRAQEQELRETLGSLLLNIARTGALLIDPTLHAHVQAMPDKNSSAYQRVRAALAKVQDENQLQTPIYTLTDFDASRQQAQFMVTSRGPGEPAEVYPLVPALLDPLGRAFREGIATYTDVYHNQHGTWITAFAPIRDASGTVIAVLDVDYGVEVYMAKLAAVRRQFYWYTLAGALVALLAGGLITRRITRPVAQLAALARRVVEGDFSTRVHVATRDEIGMLGNVLHLMVERLQVSNKSIVDVLVRALEARSGETGALRRVAATARAVGDRLEIAPTQREALELGALLHNIGEIRIPEWLLHKSEPLTPEEQQIIEQYPTWGVEILETVPLLTPALDVVGGHQERFDGGGYPQKLHSEEIPLTARIFAVADALDTLTHDGPHRRAHSIAAALEVLRQEAGKSFDPRVVEAAMSIPESQWAEILDSHAAESQVAQRGAE